MKSFMEMDHHAFASSVLRVRTQFALTFSAAFLKSVLIAVPLTSLTESVSSVVALVKSDAILGLE